MQDLKEKREQFLVAAADCELICNLATGPLKRDALRRLTEQLHKMLTTSERSPNAGPETRRKAPQLIGGQTGATCVSLFFCSTSSTHRAI